MCFTVGPGAQTTFFRREQYPEYCSVAPIRESICVGAVRNGVADRKHPMTSWGRRRGSTHQRSEEATEPADEDDGPLGGGSGLKAKEEAGDVERNAQEEAAGKRSSRAERGQGPICSRGHLHGQGSSADMPRSSNGMAERVLA